MKKAKGIIGYPAADLLLMDIIGINSGQYIVYAFDANYVYTHLVSDEDNRVTIDRSTTVRLIRKARGITYAAWQRQTSKLLKAQGLSRWPGAAVMKPLFFLSYSPEDAAAAFLSDNFLID